MKILMIKARLNRFYGQAVPPLGLLYLSAFLKKHGYRDVTILHPDVQEPRGAELEKAVAGSGADIVAISAITAEGRSMHELARLAKRLRPQALVVVGGAHPTGYARDCLKDPAIDIAVRGEGELTLLELVRSREAGRSCDAIHGISYRRGGEIVSNPAREFIEDLDTLPFPDWDAVSPDAYARFIPQTPVLFGERYGSVLTSRGCPYRCVFCHGVMGKKFRPHGPERVIGELAALSARWSLRHIEVADDIFNYDRERTLLILRGLAHADLGLKLHLCGIRMELLDREMIDLMAQAGVVYAATGLESGSRRMQRAIRKNVDLERFRDLSNHMVKRRIFVTAGFMLGFPGETVKEIFATLRYAWSLKIHTAMLAFYHPYRGTELGDALPAGQALGADDDLLPFYSSVAGIHCSSLSAWKLMLLKWLGNTVFYFNPSRIFRILRDLPNPSPRVIMLLLGKLAERTLFLR